MRSPPHSHLGICLACLHAALAGRQVWRAYYDYDSDDSDDQDYDLRRRSRTPPRDRHPHRSAGGQREPRITDSAERYPTGYPVGGFVSSGRLAKVRTEGLGKGRDG